MAAGILSIDARRWVIKNPPSNQARSDCGLGNGGDCKQGECNQGREEAFHCFAPLIRVSNAIRCFILIRVREPFWEENLAGSIEPQSQGPSTIVWNLRSTFESDSGDSSCCDEP